MDRVLFREAVHVGELVTFSASVNYLGRTSMEVGIRVETEHLPSGARRHANSSYFTMVAVGSDGKPVDLPPSAPDAEDARRRLAEAQQRRKAQRDAFTCTATT